MHGRAREPVNAFSLNFTSGGCIITDTLRFWLKSEIRSDALCWTGTCFSARISSVNRQVFN
jgi:hypothetical protein